MTTEQALHKLDLLGRYMEYFVERQINIRLCKRDAMNRLYNIRDFEDGVWLEERPYSIGYYFHDGAITTQILGRGYSHIGSFKRQEFNICDGVAFDFSEPEYDFNELKKFHKDNFLYTIPWHKSRVIENSGTAHNYSFGTKG